MPTDGLKDMTIHRLLEQCVRRIEKARQFPIDSEEFRAMHGYVSGAVQFLYEAYYEDKELKTAQQVADEYIQRSRSGFIEETPSKSV